MLFEWRIHPYSEEFVARDYFPETDTSLFDEKSVAGCIDSLKSILKSQHQQIEMHCSQIRWTMAQTQS